MKPVRCPDQNRERFQCAGENRTCHLNHVASANIVGLCDGQSVSMNAVPQFVLEQPIAELHVGQAAIHQRLDNLDRRLAQVKHRLDLVEEPTANG